MTLIDKQLDKVDIFEKTMISAYSNKHFYEQPKIIGISYFDGSDITVTVRL